jgi:hypothetical protein
MVLAGCGSAENTLEEPSRLTHADIREEAPAQNAGAGQTDGENATSNPIPVSAPKIAYVYDYGFRIAPAKIPEVQRKQADLCESKGPNICRILEMRQDGAEGDYASGTLSLAVSAPRARAFGSELSGLVGKADGKQVSSSITGEDLSKQIVDTEARLRARTLLRDRLMEVLASRNGKVSELVEAERSVAQVNEEIDQARSWLAEMQGRVAFSRINISYQSGAPSSGGFVAPIRAAMGNVGSILGTMIAFLIMAATVLVPLGLVGWALRFAIVKIRAMPDSNAEE